MGLRELDESQLLNICQALGGFEDKEIITEDGRTEVISRYVPGDEVLGNGIHPRYGP
jgi:hypothetical protein